MASSLYIRSGIGYPTIIILLLFGVLSAYSSGIAQVIFIILFALWLIFIIYRWFRWNGAGWRKIHFRGMYYYASLAGSEVASANREGREFNIFTPCFNLSRRFMGQEYTIAEIIHALTIMKEDPDHFPNIVQSNIRKLYPNRDEKFYNLVISETRKIPFGPQQVVASVIEDKLGGEDVTKYFLALLKGDIK